MMCNSCYTALLTFHHTVAAQHKEEKKVISTVPSFSKQMHRPFSLKFIFFFIGLLNSLQYCQSRMYMAVSVRMIKKSLGDGLKPDLAIIRSLS